MKATAQPLAQPLPCEKSWTALYCELFKARLTLLVLLTTLVGFYLGTRGGVDYLRLFHTLAGTALLAAGASALNQLLERDLDAKMRRTQNRPLPSGRMQPQTVLLIGAGCSTLGLLPVSLAPFLFKLAGPVYLAGAILLGCGFIWCAIQFSRQHTVGRARQLFFASIIYLPLLLTVMVLDKIK